MIYLASPRRVQRIWGALPGGDAPVGEIWWLYDDDEGSSPLTPLGGGPETDAAGLVSRGLLPGGGRYPLLVKTLHTADRLSVQVHPGRDRRPPMKEETWIVLEAATDAWMMGGLREGVGRRELMEAVERGGTEEVLLRRPLAPGDIVHVPPGTLHSLGPGVSVLEVQTNTDVTYRLYDWDRTGADGRARRLHVEESLAAIDWGAGGRPVEAGRDWTPLGRIPGCASYTLEAVTSGTASLPPGGALFLVSGSATHASGAAGGGAVAPACIVADLEGGEVLLEGEGGALAYAIGGIDE